MRVTIRRAALPRDRDALVAFDRKVFSGDAFDPEDWNDLEAYGMIADARGVGCFERDRDFGGRKRRGSLHIVSTGFLTDYAGKGLGDR